MRQKLWIGGVAIVAVGVLGVAVALMSREPAKPVAAQTTPTSGANGYSGITVQGTGVVLVKPDVVRLSIGSELKAPTVGEAQKLSAEASKKITDALKAKGVKEDDIKTESYNIRPDYNYQPNQPPQLVGYMVNNQLSVVIREIDKAGDIIDAAGGAGANQIGGINFTLDNNENALKQARTAAMDDAAKKAEQFAAAGKVGVGTIIRVIEETQNLGPRPAQDAQAELALRQSAPAPAKTVIEGGQFRVVVNVEVTYGIK